MENPEWAVFQFWPWYRRRYRDWTVGPGRGPTAMEDIESINRARQIVYTHWSEFIRAFPKYDNYESLLQTLLLVK